MQLTDAALFNSEGNYNVIGRSSKGRETEEQPEISHTHWMWDIQTPLEYLLYTKTDIASGFNKEAEAEAQRPKTCTLLFGQQGLPKTVAKNQKNG